MKNLLRALVCVFGMITSVYTQCQAFRQSGTSSFFKSFILALAMLVVGIGSSWGQVALITASNGGFEAATSTAAANGWTAVGTSTRTWRVGTAGGAATGTKAAYWGTASAFGGSGVSAVGHFYRDIAIPAGATNVFLNYKLKYPTIDNTYDYFYVFTTTTANTPVNATIPTTGYTQRFVNTATTYAAFTAMPQVDLTALAGTTVRLVFTFKTDAASPHAAPAVDDITLTYIAGSACTGTPAPGTTSASVSTGCSGTATTLTAASVTTSSGISYIWQSSTNNTTFTDIAGATSTTYVTTIPLGTNYYRIKSTCSNGGGINYSTSTTLTGNVCVVFPSNSTTSTNTGCTGTTYDPGGTANYGNSQTGTVTFYPTVSTDKVRLTFTSFSTESGYDGLVIYNGNSTSAPIISSGLAAGTNTTNCPAGSYYGTTSPETVTSTAADGSLTLIFRSDVSTVDIGFVATISCFTPPTPACASTPSPSNSSTGVTVVPTLTWAAVAYAESYDVYIGTTLPDTPTATITSTSYSPGTLSPLTAYQWKVVPKNATGSATGCSTWSFTSMSPQYATSWVSMNTGSSNWCVNETRSVTVTVKNNGSSSWDDAVADFNLGIKWNGDADYSTRVDVQNLAAGATQTFTLTITSPSTAGSNNLTFDVVRESCFWFASNSTACSVVAGPGNSVYTSSSITINDYPTSPNAGSDVSICLNQSTQLEGTVTGPTGTLHTSSSNSDFTAFTTNDATRWSISGTTNSGGTSPELKFDYVSSVTSTMWIKSPQITGTSYSILSMSFKHYCDWYTGSFILRLQTSPDGATWTDRWTTTVTADIAASTQTVNLNTLAGTSFYYRFMFDGYTWNINNWYIDDIAITGNRLVTYSWSPSTALSTTNIYNPVANPSSTTTYTMTTSLNGCSVSDQVIVTVNRPNPTTVNSLIYPDLTDGDYLWNGLTSTSWNTSSNWYQYVSSSNSFETTNSNPISTSAVYILPSSSIGSCVSSPPTLDVTDNINGLEVASGITLNLPNNLNVIGNIDINGSLSGIGSITMNGTSDQTISSISPFPNLTVNKTSGNLTLSTPVKVSGTLTMTQGNIYTTPTNILEVGTSTSTLGSVSWESGSIIGPLKRWFGTSTNSTQTSGIFPIGGNIPSKGILNRYAQVNFTQSPNGGYIIVEYKTGNPGLSTGLPIWTPTQYIQNYEEEGYWDITPYNSSGVTYGALNTFTYTLKLRMNTPSTNDGSYLTSLSRIRIISSKGPSHASWVVAGTQGVGQVQLALGDYLLEETGVTGFSWFNGGGDNNNPLPVELTQFEATSYPQWNVVKWTTASENNSSHFDIESSTDGENWRKITTIPSAGNSIQELKYSYIDYNLNELTYYRLQQFDIDGKFETYGPILVTKTITEKKIVKYINLIGQEVNPEYVKGVVIEIYDDGTMRKMIR